MAPARFIILALAAAANLRHAAGTTPSRRSSGLAVRGTASAAALLEGQQQLQQQQRLQGSHADVDTAVLGGGSRSIIVKNSEEREDQKLRLCNAFAHAAPLEITHVRLATQLAKLPYKACGDYMVSLDEGDQLDFNVDGTDVGTFSVAGLPHLKRTLLLVVHRRKGGHGKGASLTASTSVLGARSVTGAAFASHVFTDVLPSNAQVATIDTYSGDKASKVRISSVSGKNATEKGPEVLALNSVVTIVPGTYEVKLHSGEGGIGASKLFDAEGETNYVVLRVGAQGPDGDVAAFPEELVVFPQNAAARSAAATSGFVLAVLLHLLAVHG